MVEIAERVDPKEVRNWRVHLYCMGVCFGAVALGKLGHALLWDVNFVLTQLQVTMSPSWVVP